MLYHCRQPVGKQNHHAVIEKYNMVWSVIWGTETGEKGATVRDPSVAGASLYKQCNFVSTYTGIRLKVVPGPGDFPESIVESCSWLHSAAVCV